MRHIFTLTGVQPIQNTNIKDHINYQRHQKGMLKVAFQLTMVNKEGRTIPKPES